MDLNNVMNNNAYQHELSSEDKTKICLENDIDLVIELPTAYSISSAENFAQGAIKILEAFGDVTLSFGSETR